MNEPITLFDVMPDVLFVPIGVGIVAMIDYADAELMRYRWRASGAYAAGTVGGDKVLMHRVVMCRMLNAAIPAGLFVDHINGNPHDNRRANLRLANRYQNAQNQKRHCNNSSGFRGVTRAGDRWQARITAYGRRIHLGYHESPEAAYRAYCAAAIEHHGDFARIDTISLLDSEPILRAA